MRVMLNILDDVSIIDTIETTMDISDLKDFKCKYFNKFVELNNYAFNGVDVYFYNGNRYELEGTLYYKEGMNKMRKNRNELNEVLDAMIEILGADGLLQELANAQDTFELQANLEYISDMWGLDLFEEGE